jgi:ABC-type transport system involved in multi-copper enzyme maturation permease subunit
MTALLWAEIIKLHSRASARVGLVGTVILALIGPVAMAMRASMQVEGNMFMNPEFSAPNAVRWSLYVREFYVVHALLILLAVQSYAGELQARTLREDLVRPVRREQVLLAKWGALATWSFLSVLLQLALASAVAVVLHPATGSVEWKGVLLGYGAAWIAEVGFAASALAVGVASRSVGGGIIGMFLFVVLERIVAMAVWMVRYFVTSVPNVEDVQMPFRVIAATGPWFPSSGWSVWQDLVNSAPITWQAWVALAVWTVLAMVVAERVFARTDVP